MVTECADGSVVFRMYNPHAGCVEIQGDFAPADAGGVVMSRDAVGWWTARLRLAPGDHTFRYVINGTAPMPDYAANGLIRNGKGEWVSCVSVPERAAVGAAPGRDAMETPVEAEPAVAAPSRKRRSRGRAAVAAH